MVATELIALNSVLFILLHRVRTYIIRPVTNNKGSEDKVARFCVKLCYIFVKFRVHIAFLLFFNRNTVVNFVRNSSSSNYRWIQKHVLDSTN